MLSYRHGEAVSKARTGRALVTAFGDSPFPSRGRAAAFLYDWLKTGAIVADYRPYDDWDYKLDDQVFGDEQRAWNQLLTDDEPNPLLTDRSARGLSAIAAALHKHGPHMKPEHLEKAVWWIKDWKAARVGWYRTATASMEFSELMNGLKTTKEFLASSRSASRYSIAASAVTALFGVVVVTVAMLFFNGAGGWWTWGGVLVALFTLACAGALTERARDIWKLQDRQYFLKCIRAARCTEDLNEAGLFAFGESYNERLTWAREKKFRGEMNDLQRKLGDALYFDYDQYMRAPFNEDLIREENERNAAPPLKPA